MISMRYHIVSLAAIFLALALGIVLGATKINSPLLAGLQGDNTQLSSQKDDLAAQSAELENRVMSDSKFASSIGALAVRGTLPNTQVVVITTDTADPADRDGVLSLLAHAGAVVTAQLQITADFSDPARAGQLRDLAIANQPVGSKLPESAQAGTLSGGFLATLLLTKADGKASATPEEATAALSALSAAGFISASGPVAPGRSVVIIDGTARTSDSAVDRAQAIADMAAALKTSAAGVVIAGRSGSEGTTGSVGLVRADTAASALVSTVDDVDTDAGRIATVLALVEQNGGGVGRYGLGKNATAPAPTLALG
ncbi:MAG: copper transporter [Nakamurella sp.]